jgi:hypothetical protein
MKHLRAVVIATMLSCCAPAPFSGPTPSGPVKDAATAIVIAKRNVFRHRDDPAYEWQATAQNGEWKVIGTRFGKMRCGDTQRFEVDVQADTGKILEDLESVIVC